MTPRWSWVLLLACFVGALCSSREAMAIDRNFAGSAQLDYHYAPGQRADGRPATTFDGFTMEAGLKLAVDVSDRLSANVKVCFGCHGFETNMAYFDYRVADELNFRVGRFSPSFGAFNLRHDPANHRLSDKPLAYDMGRMLRLRDWNMGVLPSPFPDNGAEINGTHWFGSQTQVDYAVYAVSGFKGNTAGTDLDWVQSRSGNLYYVDNNGRPSYGGRLSTTVRFAKNVDATLGASGTYGTFDPENRLAYLIYGSDLSFRFARTNLRFEYLARRQALDLADASRFKYTAVSGGDFFVKHGGYAELEVPVAPSVDLIGRFDVLYRSGNVLVTSPLQARSAVVRYTLGAAYTLERGLRVKLSTSLYSFSDVDVEQRHNAASAHAAVVGTF